VDRDDTGVLHRCRRLGLGQEARPLLGAGVLAAKDHLQGHDPVEGDLAGLEDDAHAATTQVPQHLVARRGVYAASAAVPA
jgi:hypothetical protein